MKYCGIIGFIVTEEDPPESGIWREHPVERIYYGDVIRNSVKNRSANQQVNDNVEIANQLSIVADSFAYNNFHRMRYAECMGAKWKIESIEVQRPRLTLTLGGEYNGEQA